MKLKILFFALCAIIAGISNGQTSIFNGKSLKGWECSPVEQVDDWTIVNGELVGANPNKKGSI